MKTRFLISILILLPMLANAYDFEVNGIYYNILSVNDRTVEVTKNDGYDSEYSGTIHIPATVSYENVNFRVTAIGERAFKNSLVTAVFLPDGLTTIKKEAFWYSRDLKKCDLPNSVTYIGDASFVAVAIDSLYISSTIEYLGDQCYATCQMSYLELEEGITSISNRAFSGCQNLKTIVLPSTFSKIEAESFGHCMNIKTIISKNEIPPTMYGSHWSSGGLGTGTVYNPFEFSEKFNRYIYTLLVPQGAKDSYSNYNTIDGKPGWPVVAIEEYDESTDFSKIGNEFYHDSILYAITNNGNNNSLLLVNTMVDSVRELIIRDKIYKNSIEYNITSVHPGFISNNKSLRVVHAYSKTPISIYENTFSSNTKLFGTLYVPIQTKSIYETVTEWKDFSNIIETDEVIPPTPNPKCSAPTISYSNEQLIFECDTEDVKFVSSVVCIDNKNHDTSIVPLTAIYRISVYATKDGYDNSDIVEKEISIRGLKGDVNEDSEINIADINSTIDIILGK